MPFNITLDGSGITYNICQANHGRDDVTAVGCDVIHIE